MQNVKFQIFLCIDSIERIYFYSYHKYKLLQGVEKSGVESGIFVSLHSWYTEETKRVLKNKYNR